MVLVEDVGEELLQYRRVRERCCGLEVVRGDEAVGSAREKNATQAFRTRRVELTMHFGLVCHKRADLRSQHQRGCSGQILVGGVGPVLSDDLQGDTGVGDCGKGGEQLVVLI